MSPVIIGLVVILVILLIVVVRRPALLLGRKAVDQMKADAEKALEEGASILIKLRDGLICPFCAADTTSSQIQCPSCGREIVHNCPHCGAKLPLKRSSCPQCKKELMTADELATVLEQVSNQVRSR